jgi:UDP-N-acetylmuramyl pentapeptide phosphotransferase/UDP-N-acetylglucosamine-1-phosphate transferase
MSDIQINLDGLIAFLVAAALALILLLVLAVVSLRGALRARREGERFSRQMAFPRVLGMLVSLSCCAIVLLLVWLNDGGVTHTFNAWLDRLSPLWGALIIAVAPVSSRLIKGRLRFAAADAPVDTPVLNH